MSVRILNEMQTWLLTGRKELTLAQYLKKKGAKLWRKGRNTRNGENLEISLKLENRETRITRNSSTSCTGGREGLGEWAHHHYCSLKIPSYSFFFFSTDHRLDATPKMHLKSKKELRCAQKLLTFYRYRKTYGYDVCSAVCMQYQSEISSVCLLEVMR